MKIFLEIKQIKELLRLTKCKPRDHTLFHMAFTTGLRISDLLSIKRDSVIDSDGKIVRALHIKTKKTKTWLDKPLRDDCRKAIKSYLKTRRDKNPYMFPPDQIITRYGTNTTRPMGRMTAHRLYKRYLRALYPESMLVGAATHTPRRSMGKIISKISGRIEPVSRFLGHKNCASTAAYIDMDGHEETANDIVTEIKW